MEAVHFERSVANVGDIARLQRIFSKARSGEDITLGFIGGSITQGAWASKPDNKWTNHVAAWWRNNFPLVKTWTIVNAGIGATGSNIAVHRIQKDLLQYNPDLVFVEFAVNDQIASKSDVEKTYEGLMRQILKHPSEPAVLALCTMTDKGSNVQDIHLPIARHYNIPMISYRDAMWPDLESRQIEWSEIAHDYVHPNDTGHKICGQLLCNYIKKALLKKVKVDTIPSTKILPKPLFSGTYENVAIYDYTSLKPVQNIGWKKSKDKTPFGYSWVSEKVGSKLEFEIDSAAISLIVRHINGDVGIIKVTIDDCNSTEVNAWFDQDWGTPHLFHKLYESKESTKHQLTIELTGKKTPESNGHYFEISAVCIAGYE